MTATSWRSRPRLEAIEVLKGINWSAKRNPGGVWDVFVDGEKVGGVTRYPAGDWWFHFYDANMKMERHISGYTKEEAVRDLLRWLKVVPDGTH